MLNKDGDDDDEDDNNNNDERYESRFKNKLSRKNQTI